MAPFLALLLAANPGALPPLSDLTPFPSLDLANARIDQLNEQSRHVFRMPRSQNRNAAMEHIEFQIECWETLRQAHTGTGRPGRVNDPLPRRRALRYLKEMLTDTDYAAGRMP